MNYKVAMVSLGCSKNLVDSEVMIKLIKENNYDMAAAPEDADIIIINTCGFIESAKQESIDTIIEMGQYKNNGKCKVLIASGCLSERYKDDLLNEMPELDAVIGVGDYKDIISVFDKTLQGEKVVKYGNQERISIDVLSREITTMGTSAYLKIAEGCSNFCTYCIIPKIRGKYRSRRFEDIIEEAKFLAKKGIKELNIIAQDTTKYGIDIYGEFRLAELLREISKIDGIEWIRFLYSYPETFTDELIEEMAVNKKICKYLDIPIQHISNRLLKKMARKSTNESVRELIAKLRRKMPDIVIRTTLIVGFPGETEDDFQQLFDFVNEIKFERLGVFTYSREEDTPAYKMRPQIEENTKIERQEKLMLLQQQISKENNKKSIGRELTVLIEGTAADQYFGRSYMDAPEIDGMIFFKSKKALFIGDMCQVMITSADEYDLMGELK